MTGVLAVQDFDSMITGDASLKKRPMGRIVKPLISCGAKIEANEHKAPLSIYGSTSLTPIEYYQDVASAQVKSCLILSALHISGQSTFHEEIETRDHTENLLEHLSYEINRDSNFLSLKGKQKLIAKDILIGSDISSAAFFIVACLIVDGSFNGARVATSLRAVGSVVVTLGETIVNAMVVRGRWTDGMVQILLLLNQMLLRN